MSELIPLETAQAIIMENVRPMPVEQVSSFEALGRVVACDLFSDIDINGFDDAAMDGFALRAEDIVGATESNPVELKIVDVIGAGTVHQGVLQPGEAVRIMTGAAMPEGADANAKIEDVRVTGEGLIGDTVIFASPLKAGANVRRAGEEARAGQLVFKKGQPVNAAGMGLLASTGNLEVPVYRRPLVGVMSIGTELVDSSQVPGMGMKRDSNRHTLAAMAREAGADTIMYPIVADDEASIRVQYEKAAAECDVVVSSGGACGGDFDYITQVISSIADIKFEFVNMRPGKAQTFGVTPRGTLLFGLSGNPAACATGFEVLVRPALLRAQGREDVFRPTVEARLIGEVKVKDRRRCLLRAVLGKNEQGEYIVEPLRQQSSAVISATSQSNCFLVVREGEGRPEVGSMVTCMRIDLPAGTVC